MFVYNFLFSCETNFDLIMMYVIFLILGSRSHTSSTFSGKKEHSGLNTTWSIREKPQRIIFKRWRVDEGNSRPINGGCITYSHHIICSCIYISRWIRPSNWDAHFPQKESFKNLHNIRWLIIYICHSFNPLGVIYFGIRLHWTWFHDFLTSTTYDVFSITFHLYSHHDPHFSHQLFITLSK